MASIFPDSRQKFLVLTWCTRRPAAAADGGCKLESNSDDDDDDDDDVDGDVGLSELFYSSGASEESAVSAWL